MAREMFYTAPDGQKYPLEEAAYDMSFKVYRSDRRKAVQSSPQSCVLAKGIARHRDVEDVWIGSGLDAYVVFKETEDKAAHAVHFTIRTTVRKLIDAFDTNKKIQSQIITLSRPTKGRTLSARAKMNARRQKEIAEGAPVRKRAQTPRSSRMDRLGVPHRPTAPISRGGSVDVHSDLHV